MHYALCKIYTPKTLYTYLERAFMYNVHCTMCIVSCTMSIYNGLMKVLEAQSCNISQ